MLKDLLVMLAGPKFFSPTHHIFVDLGLTTQQINAIMDGWASRPEASNWDEAALREFIGLENSNPFDPPAKRDPLQERLDRKAAEKRAQKVNQRPAWHSMIVAE